MTKLSILKTSVVGVVCAAVAAAGGIAESSAATHHPTAQRPTRTWWPAGSHPAPALGWGDSPAGFEGGAIHATVIEPAADGGYANVTYDTGVLISVGSASLTVQEGPENVTYARPTIRLKGTTAVWLNGRRSRLSALAAHDRIAIIRSSTGTTTNTVFATTSKSGAGLLGAATHGPTLLWRSGNGHGWTGRGGWTGPRAWSGPDGWGDRGGEGGW